MNLMDKQQSLSLERKILLFEQILNGYQTSEIVTRKGLVEANHLRPATVTKLIGELLDFGLVKEDMKTHVSGPGRPEVYLIPNKNQYNAIFVYVDSLTLTASLVNLTGEILYSSSCEFENRSATKDLLISAIESQVRNAYDTIEAGTTVCGVILSLPGIVDRKNQVWKYSNRWPNATDISFASLEETLACKVILVKNLQAELNAFILENKQLKSRNTLYIHWGEGIGAASYDASRMARLRQQGLFSEIGQTIIDNDGSTLEQIASLASLRDTLGQNLNCIIGNEKQCAEQIKDLPLSSLPCLEQAQQVFSRSLVNAYLTLFPDTIILTGPFIENTCIFEEIKRQFFAQLPSYCPSDIQLLVNSNTVINELQGAVIPFFSNYVNDKITQAHN